MKFGPEGTFSGDETFNSQRVGGFLRFPVRLSQSFYPVVIFAGGYEFVDSGNSGPGDIEGFGSSGGSRTGDTERQVWNLRFLASRTRFEENGINSRCGNNGLSLPTAVSSSGPRQGQVSTWSGTSGRRAAASSSNQACCFRSHGPGELGGIPALTGRRITTASSPSHD